MIAGVVDENAAHGLGGGSNEMTAVIPMQSSLATQPPQVGFVDQPSRLQRLPRLLLTQMSRRQLAQLFADQGQKLLRGAWVALLNRGQNARHVGHEREVISARGEEQEAGCLQAIAGRGFDRIVELKQLVARLATGVLGFEPRQTDPESVVLPLHYTPKQLVFRLCSCRRRLETANAYPTPGRSKTTCRKVSYRHPPTPARPRPASRKTAHGHGAPAISHHFRNRLASHSHRGYGNSL